MHDCGVQVLQATSYLEADIEHLQAPEGAGRNCLASIQTKYSCSLLGALTHERLYLGNCPQRSATSKAHTRSATSMRGKRTAPLCVQP